MSKKANPFYSIRSKLISAVSMMLIAVIMVVSSTYAWFTLSTAPEVTGITTAIGANGSLEMALLEDLNLDDIQTSTSQADPSESNLTWGNLVDLGYAVDGKSYYGFDKITLYPSRLNTAEGNNMSLNRDGALLLTPQYGADGRIEKLNANAYASVFNFDKGNFPASTGAAYGAAAIGVASGMTERQLAYRTALSNAITAKAAAKTLAAQSLSNNGGALANVALKKAMDSTANYKENVAPMNNIITSLLGDGANSLGALQYIENAYRDYLLAIAASKVVQDVEIAKGLPTDSIYTNLKNSIESADSVTAAITAIQSELTTNNITLDLTSINTYAGKIEATKGEVTTAQTKLATLTGDTVSWTEFSGAVYSLVDIDNMVINEFKASEVSSNMSALMNSVASGGITVTMGTGCGAYADIADHCGDYSVSVVIEKIAYDGLELTNLNATMTTKTTIVPTQHLDEIQAVASAASNYPTSEGASDLPISEFFGYVIDLGFRTNAADSNLLLQTTPADRIYDDNDTSAATYGKGSTMTFKSVDPNFGDAQVLSLMKSIRIVLFNPKSASDNIYSYAMLDIGSTDPTLTEATFSEDGWTANIYLYEDVVAYNVTLDNDSTVVCLLKEGVYYNTTTDEVVTPKADTTPVETTLRVVKNNQSDAIITPLTQNVGAAVSVLVYLDGDTVQNKDVAATASQSMTGKMNIQFSSSANLVPMEYAGLHNATAPTTTAPAGN